VIVTDLPAVRISQSAVRDRTREGEQHQTE
jgi:hypothetical protein